MRFGVLGPVTAWTDDGRVVTVPGLKVRALLADLLIHEGRPVPADRLIDDLWGTDLPGNPAGTLSAKVSQLRRAFEDAEPGSRVLVTSGPAGYALKVSADTHDALAFAEYLRGGRLAHALELWRGPAYADFTDEGFAQPTIARLTEQRIAAQEEYLEQRVTGGDHAVDELADLIADHPLRERLRATHMKALYRAGRQSEALDSYEQLRRLLADELGLDPSPELVALHQSILTQELPSKRSNLPAQLTELIGRDQAVDQLADSLETSRLVTLTGPGGVGKTRLAVATASAVSSRFADGVVLVELASVTRGALDVMGSITDELQGALDLRDAAGPSDDALDRLAAVLGTRLLVLDNCEQIVDEVALVTSKLLTAAPQLHVLATSREPLGITGEAVWNVPTLEVPALGLEVDELQKFSAVQLFVARAASADRSFRLTSETAEAVSTLCRRLDGIPLALELAATRVRSLGIRGLVARLDDRFRLLATGHRGAAPRQQTLLAMIDWSWQLLGPDEQIVLRRLSAHADGCTPEAAEAVCAEAGVDVLDVLVRLVDRSLVVALHGSDGPRYRLLESVAVFCVDRLHEAGELDELRQRHRRYYVSLAEEARPHLFGHEQGRWLRLLDEDAANLRVAFEGAVADGDDGIAGRLVAALGWYWFLRGRFAEARRWLEAVPSWEPAAAWRVGFMYLQGDPEARAARDAVSMALGAWDEWWLAFTSSDAGDLVTCEQLLDSALKRFEADQDRWGIAAVLVARAKHAHVRADLVALRRDATESARLFRQLGDRWGQLQAMSWLGGHAEMIGDFDEAARLHTECLHLAEELGLWTEAAGALALLAWTELRQGRYHEARLHADRGLRMSVEQGNQATAVLASIVLGFAARRTGDLAEAKKRLSALIEEARAQDEPALHLSMVLSELGFTMELLGEPAQARELHAEAFRISRAFDSRRGMCGSLEGLAACVADKTVAAKLLGAAARVRTADGYTVTAAESADLERAAAAAEEVLGAERFRLAYESPLSLAEAWALVDPD